MKILYITRKFPPSIGGMQVQSYQFYGNLSKENDVILISWGHSQVFLPLFIFFAFLRSVIALATSKIDIVQLGDFVLSPLGALLKLLFNRPTFTISHGRDSAYKNLLYDSLVVKSAKKLDKVICVSENMKGRFLLRGLADEKLEVIPNGISVDDFNRPEAKREGLISELESCYGIRLEKRKIIFSASRLVGKKGIKEFIEEIFIKIACMPEEAVFLIAGEGPEKERIAQAIERLGLGNRVYLLGSVRHNSNFYKALFGVADVFVMPNIKVEDDAEGFGVVALEAALMGVPVVAYDVDGISQAIHNNENGILVDEGDKDSFLERVSFLLKDNSSRQERVDRARRYVIDNFSWNKILKSYINLYSRSLAERDSMA